MPTEKQIQLEIAHILFMDVVGYSKLSVEAQHAAVEELNSVVRSLDQVQQAETANRLLKIPTGDGMALVFYSSPEVPAQCAVEISRAIKNNSRLQLRMGVHSGPVSGLVDVNERPNLAGAGINIAQRVMDCGDSGHVLVSKRVAEDLEQYDRWRPLLHDLGTCEVKHGVRINIANVYDTEFGNPQLPSKLRAARRRTRLRWAKGAIAVLAVAGIATGILLKSKILGVRRLSRKASRSFHSKIARRKRRTLTFADAIQDEILTRLSKIADLKVISRTSTLHYKSAPENLPDIARQLGVAHILEGSVQKIGDVVRVNVQLIKAANDSHLWADTLDRKLTDILSVERVRWLKLLPITCVRN